MRFLTLLCVALTAATTAAAQNRDTLGVGRLFSNDFIGDGEDRWRSGSYSASVIRGEGWAGRAPSGLGALLEYRFRTEIIAPSALNGTGSDDRAYVGAVSAGLHTYAARGPFDYNAGLDLVFTGPQTGVSAVQDVFHDLISAPSVGEAVEDNQLGNAVYPTLTGQVAYNLPISETVSLRPFAQARLGVEDVTRVGADILIGGALRENLWVRDSTTGHLYSGVSSDGVGFGFVLGGDYALVHDSEYFPSDFGAAVKEEQFRLRAGAHARLGDGHDFFYGLTYLSEEYEGQSEGQTIGSLRLSFNF